MLKSGFKVWVYLEGLIWQSEKLNIRILSILEM